MAQAVGGVAVGEIVKLLDNGWEVLLFRDGAGTYSALAVREGGSVDDAVAAWAEYDPLEQDPAPTPAESVFDGPNRYCGCGVTPAAALDAVASKVIFRRLPPRG